MKKIKIMFTSDIHGHFYPTDYLDSKKKPAGLFHIAQEFHKDENTLILDGGDILQGSPFAYYSQMTKNPEAAAELMNEAGYDVVTIGNHDFNYGDSYLLSYLNKLNACCVCQNCVEKGSGKILFPWKIFQMQNGIRVGVIGAVTDFVNVWEKEENISDFKSAGNLDLIYCLPDISICRYRDKCLTILMWFKMRVTPVHVMKFRLSLKMITFR